MKKRYRYHVFYKFWTNDGREGIGSVTHLTNLGILNTEKCMNSIMRDRGYKSIMITSYTKA